MEREDMSSWLIHFTKDINVNNEVDVLIESNEFTNGELVLDYTNQFNTGINTYTAFDVLCNIIRECGIRYGYSFRNGKTTLYGGEPVICFTEMPIFSLIQYAKRRNSDSNSTFGIAIRKDDAFKYGARPVIYGLSEDTNISYIKNTSTLRILKECILPKHEQYRLVALKLGDDKVVDWTHEREWRIKRRNDITHNTFIENGYELVEIEHLNIFEENGFCKEIILIVDTDSQADELYDLILPLMDSHSNEYGVSFCPNKLSILIIGNLKNETKPFRKIEDISPKSYFKVELPNISNEELKWLEKVILYCREVISKEATEKYLKKHKIDDEIKDFRDACGYSNIVCYESRNKYLRGLIKICVATPLSRSYLIKATEPSFSSQSISFHEFIANEVCDYLNSKIENIFYVKSYMD